MEYIIERYTLMLKRLTAMPYAHAFVSTDRNRIALVSYSTLVAEIVGGVLRVYGLYSMTTRRHISAFVKEYAGITYQTAKLLCINNLCMDIATGDKWDAETGVVWED